MKELLELAVDRLREKGVDYGDARIGWYRYQNIQVRDSVAVNLSTHGSEGIGIRARVGGGWGFFSTQDLTQDGVVLAVDRALEIARASAMLSMNAPFAQEATHQVVWKTPYEIDPFSISIQEKTDLLMEINRVIRSNPAVARAVSFLNFSREHKMFMSTEGSQSDQLLMRVDGACIATAIGPEGFESRTFSLTPLNIGYEHVLKAPWFDEAARIADEAVEKLHAPVCPEEQTDLILLPTHTCLVIHETIGHATELDRVMGWEADMAGTSFATTDRLRRLQYGSEIFNVVADRTMPNGRSTVMVDDEGVATGAWHLIRDGVLTGYSTTRSTAHYIGEERSRGCSYADSWSNVPILRMPNVSIEPGIGNAPSYEELLADTSDGVLVDGMGSFSIDHQRINFQFGGDAVWRIRNGRKEHMLRRFTYQSHNPVFWNSVDTICRQDEWRPEGVVNCGKGQPMQRAQLTHGSAPLRLRNITIGRAKI
ncbi:TldD/PmbA family protein [bacterium]|nr:TldD/PmbA family protein [candidate division CSSED10-310 bacterium]